MIFFQMDGIDRIKMAAFQQMKDRLDALALDITAGVTKGEYVEFITTIADLFNSEKQHAELIDGCRSMVEKIKQHTSKDRLNRLKQLINNAEKRPTF